MRTSDFHFENKAGEMPVIYINDDIGPEWLGMVSDKTVARAMAEIGDVPEILVRINSPGGDVFAGIAIHNLFKQSRAKVTTEVIGLAASAASLAAIGGHKVRMAANSMMMIHNAWTIAAGNAKQLVKVASILDTIDESLVGTYVARTGLPQGEIERLLDKETWLTAEAAVEKGFADEVLPAVSAQANVCEGRYRNTPEQFLVKVEHAVIPVGEGVFNEIDPTIQVPAEPPRESGLEVILDREQPKVAASLIAIRNRLLRAEAGLQVAS